MTGVKKTYINIFMSEVKIEPNMSLEKAMKILKKKLDREGTIKEVKKRKHFQKKSRTNYEKKRTAKYNARLESERNRLWR